METLTWLWDSGWLRLNILVVAVVRTYFLIYLIIKVDGIYKGHTGYSKPSILYNWRPTFPVSVFITLVWLYNLKAPSLNGYVEDLRRTEQFRLALFCFLWARIVGTCLRSKRKIIVVEVIQGSSEVFLGLVDRSLHVLLHAVTIIQTAIQPVVVSLLLILIIGRGQLVLISSAAVEGVGELTFSFLEVALSLAESFILTMVIIYYIKSRRNH